MFVICLCKSENSRNGNSIFVAVEASFSVDFKRILCVNGVKVTSNNVTEKSWLSKNKLTYHIRTRFTEIHLYYAKRLPFSNSAVKPKRVHVLSGDFDTSKIWQNKFSASF